MINVLAGFAQSSGGHCGILSQDMVDLGMIPWRTMAKRRQFPVEPHPPALHKHPSMGAPTNSYM